MSPHWNLPTRLDRDTLAVEAGLGARWRRPAACALVYLGDDGPEVARVHLGEDEPLPAIALAHIHGPLTMPDSLEVSARQFEQMLDVLEACELRAQVEHPAAPAWRYALGEIEQGMQVRVVLLDRLDHTQAVHDDIEAVRAFIHRGRKENPDGTTTLYRPVGPEELELLGASGMRQWPARLPDQPIFYPVLNEPYARQIAQEWNMLASGAGFVTRFDLATAFARRYPTRQAGGPQHLELWIPADQVEEVNRNLRGVIEVVG